MNKWNEYDSAAEWCAKRGLKGSVGDPLPQNLSKDALAEIDADPEAFEERVKMTAYALAMNKRDWVIEQKKVLNDLFPERDYPHADLDTFRQKMWVWDTACDHIINDTLNARNLLEQDDDHIDEYAGLPMMEVFPFTIRLH